MKKILIIEDDKSIAELERDYLEIENFEVDIEKTGTEGCKKALKTDYDLIILDLMLPGLNGFDICKKIREEKEIPVLMVSAKKEDIDKIRGLGLGADDFITKPFSPGELVARVKAHLNRYERLKKGEEKKENIIQIRGLKIDCNSRRVFLNDKEIFLAAKEYDILLLFAQNPDRVYSKNDVFSKIWGDDSYGDITTVTVHIRKIREKIEKDPSNPVFIETLWGVGYRLSI
jgi:DNA-binding response OmpR family regulator